MGGVGLQSPTLDVGAGDGHFASVAYDRALDVGLDLPGAGLDEARRRQAYRSVVPASATHMPFRDRSFGSVVSNSVLEHIPELDAALAEIARVLQPGGVFAFTSPSELYDDFLLGSRLLSRLGADGLVGAYGQWWDSISRHWHRLSPDEWRFKLERLGFRTVHWRYYFSPSQHGTFELSHFVGAPSILARRITGRWVPVPAVAHALHGWLAPHTSPAALQRGAYLFFICSKL
jgi:ubiquinone/menaquinone biosynthesis C-methylase UbiE